jgi:hypothetical protein
VKRFFGKIPEPLRRFARGQDQVEAPLDRASPDEADARALLEDAELLFRLEAPEPGRDPDGEMALLARTSAGDPVRATIANVAVFFGAPRFLAAQGEPGLRAAVREVLRLAADERGENLSLEDSRFEREVVYAIYRPTPIGPLGRAVGRIVAWSDGKHLLIALRPRDELQ